MFANGRIQTLVNGLKLARRRGTILLLVLGALAMVLILTVVYAALGKGDRTTGRAVNANRGANEVVGRFADHVVGIVGTDIFDVVPDMAEQAVLEEIDPGASFNELPGIARYMGERVDKPLTDFSMLSVPSAAGGSADAAQLSLRQFRPSGGHSTLTVWPADDVYEKIYLTDPRHAADPFLASTRPTDLGPGSKSDQLLGGSYDDAPFFARALDWHQISNVAPDGRFVNLAFLRDNFDIPSLDLTREPGSENARLSLFDDDGRAVVQGDGGFVLGFEGVEDYAGQDIDDNGNADPDWNVPAHWTMYQRNMARTIAELSRAGFDTNDPSDPRYWEYSYADADGDGIIDSRWFELVDASSGVEVPLLGDSDRRYFAAVRVIDLSSLANINTASDTIAAPTLDNRAGQGPHDVSLFTLLTLDMHREAVTGAASDIDDFGGDENEATYESFFTALNGTDERNDYDDVDEDEQTRFGRKAYLRLRQSLLDWQVYPVYAADRPFSGVPGETVDGDAWTEDLTNYSPFAVNEPDAEEGEGALDLRREDYALIGSSIPGFAGGGNARTGPFGVSDLVELLTFHGANDPATFSSLERAFLAYNGYDGGEDSPLRTRSLLRSDRSLEAEIGVEVTDQTGSEITAEEHNRRARAQLDLRSLLTTVSGARPLRSATGTAESLLGLDSGLRRFRADALMLGSPAYEGQGLSLDQIAEAQRDARDPLVENGFEIYLRTLAPFLEEFEGGTAWPTVGGSGVIGAVDPRQLETMFYGHTGPEMAIRMAAHMAVNFRDAADAPFVDLDNDGVPDPGALVGVEPDSANAVITIDTDGDGIADSANRPSYGERRDEPTAALLWLVGEDERDQASIDRLAALVRPPALNNTIGAGLSDFAPVLDADVVLGKDDPADSVLVTDPNQERSADAMIVYGVEAQPFLSEVFYFNAYWDAPRRPVERPQGGSLDWTTGGTGAETDWLVENPVSGEYWIERRATFSEFNSDPGVVRGTVTIDGAVDEANPDFLFQVLAFQLVNPFDVPVSLDDFYIEFGGWLYRPSPIGGLSVVLEPRTTQVLFATNPGLDISDSRRTYLRIIERIQNLADQSDDWSGVGFTAPRLGENGVLPNAVGQQIVEGVLAGTEIVPLERFQVDGTRPTSDFDDLLAGDPSDYGTFNPQNAQALLWWDLGARQTPSSGAGWRRDDLLADRLSDPRDATEPPSIDQRLNLPDVEYDSTVFIANDGVIPDALLADGFDINAPTSIAFAEDLEAFLPTGIDGLNEDNQRSIGLWSRIRRFDLTSDDAGAGGRWANQLPGPDGLVPSPPPNPPGGTLGPDGDQLLAGVPAGSLPAAVLESDMNGTETTDDRFQGPGPKPPFRPNELFFNESFPVFPPAPTNIKQSYESASTLDGFINGQILDPARFSQNRQGTLIAEPFDPLRYASTTGPNAVYADVTANTARTEPYAGRDLIQISHNSREFRSEITGFPQLRVGDLLNVLAVGPYRMPLRTTGAIGADGYPTDPAARIQAYTDQWTTLGEALGVAESTLPGDALEDPSSGNSDAFDALAGVLDRGHLRLDAFVPYFDFDPVDGAFNDVIDRVRGLGIPLALTIYDLVQAGGELPDGAYGGIDRAVAGLININTAPPSILRLLPGLYQDAPFGEDESVWPAWAGRTRELAQDAGLAVAYSNAFFRGSADDNTPSGGAAALYDPLDIASSILSYREPSAGYDRILRAGGLTSQAVVNASLPLNMGPLAVLDDGGNADLTRGVEILRDAVDTDGNGDTLFDVSGPNIEGLRTTPGFASIGELLAVRPGGEVGTGEDARRFQFGMDWLARDRRTVSQLFIDPATGEPAAGEPDFTQADQVRDFVFGDGARVLSLDPSLLGDPLRFSEDAGDRFQLPVADQIPDDYDEQLIQMNLLANSVSTSSDFYAAWMVIHGFADDDVEGLDDNEPMRPSFAVRYLMIIDRSNVVDRDDSPRVLAFLEVPYDEEIRRAVYTPE